MKSIISFLTATALLASSVAAKQCQKGYGPVGNDCEPCPAGYYNNQDAGVCQPAQPGWYACGTIGFSCIGATDQTKCGAGYYSSSSGSSYCTKCPAGSICPSDTTTQPQLCSPGQYMDEQGSGLNRCKSCPVGTYNDEDGATACCKCCAGTYNDQVSQTHCFYCGEHTNPQIFYSPVGSTSVNQCQAEPIDGVTNAPKGTCDVTHPTHAGSGDCPAEQGTLPSPRAGQKRRHLECARGFKKCPLYTGVGGFDCVDVKNDPEQCGGCIAVDGVPTVGEEGQDCTAIPHVSVVDCVKGSCVIQSCRKGYTKSADGKSCQSGSNLHVQQHNDSAKRTRRWHVSHSEN